MNFQNVVIVLDADDYLDAAFKKSKKISIKNKSLLPVARAREVSKYLVNALKRIYSEFPNIDGLSEFYIELITNFTDVDKLRKALSKIMWASKKINELTKEYCRKEDFKPAALYGRISSVMKQINSHLKIVEKARYKLKSLPDIKDNMFTVCIAGFPNVGKSTLLSKITSSKPEINSYAFTTKKLNMGYFTHHHKKIQIIDTPGTLARYHKMNSIEKMAYLAIKYEADLVVFIYDLTEEYPISSQNELLKLVKEFDKPIIFYLSKTDIIPEEKINTFKNKKHTFTTPEDIKNEIIRIGN